MPVDNKKQELRSILAGKSTEELEELIALDFTEQENAEVDADYINIIMEVISEREGNKEKETQAAWMDFQEYYRLRKQEELESGTTVESSHDHHCKTEKSQKPKRYFRAFRYAIVAAAVVVLLCGTAFSWNVFRAIAEWTTETFYFLTGQESTNETSTDVYEHLRVAAARNTSLPVIPKWAPSGCVESEELSVAERKDRLIVQSTFTVGEREFTVRIIIYDDIPDTYAVSYQKDSAIEEKYIAGGITHYIVGNYQNLNVMWTNGCVEGCIWGPFSLEEVQKMIDSIYEE